ncbi:uncharacterized protein LOC142643997 [Castanea sativa]|uniref:uncharacterized protein LOC142643997 n=1 Tax=Castanea sativa TaxID=21020 RepID=UPI003F653A01
MRALGWNCRGICNASTVRALRAQKGGHKPDVIFLCETKANEECMEYVKRRVGFNENVVIEAKGRAGGLCLMWRNNVQIEVVEFNKYMIAVKILDPGGDWYLVGFYGPPYAAKKRKAWENLCALLETFQEPWICFGDVNIFLDSEEKDGGRAESSMSLNFLKDILFELGAIDLGFSGCRFTWRKKRWGKNVLRERLDRGISSMSWRLVFPKATIHHLGAINSDHCPILLGTQPAAHYLPRPFRFEAAWTRDTKCYGIIDEAWKEEVEGSDFSKLCMKQLNTQMALSK